MVSIFIFWFFSHFVGLGFFDFGFRFFDFGYRLFYFEYRFFYFDYRFFYFDYQLFDFDSLFVDSGFRFFDVEFFVDVFAPIILFSNNLGFVWYHFHFHLYYYLFLIVVKFLQILCYFLQINFLLSPFLYFHYLFCLRIHFSFFLFRYQAFLLFVIL